MRVLLCYIDNVRIMQMHNADDLIHMLTFICTFFLMTNKIYLCLYMCIVHCEDFKTINTEQISNFLKKITEIYRL